MSSEGLPKFLVANDQKFEREFIIHTQSPRFIAEVMGDPEPLEPHWLDDIQEVPIEDVKCLMADATAFYLQSLRDEAERN